MSGALARVGGLFLAPPADGPSSAASRPAAAAIVVLCAPSRAGVAASALALALARARGRSCGLAAAVGDDAVPGGLVLPAAHRVAGRLRARGHEAAAAGRLVWLGVERGADDSPGSSAVAASAAVARAAGAVLAPAALAIPLARDARLDGVLADHDGIVVVPEPNAAPVVLEQALASLAALGRPVARMPPPSRAAGALALAGVRAPAVALRAVAELGLGGGS